MAAWTKEQKLDALMEVILWDHQPQYYDEDSGCAGDVYRCSCGDAGNFPDHLREMIDNEGLLEDDPGVR
jgi:hypothetical protein